VRQGRKKGKEERKEGWWGRWAPIIRGKEEMVFWYYRKSCRGQ